MQYGTARIRKRHIPSPEPETKTKRRLLDNLANLSLDQFSPSPAAKPRAVSPFESPSFDQNIYRSNLFRHDDPNKIVITNIDQFLSENPDCFDEFIGTTERIEDFNKIKVENLVIPTIEPATSSASTNDDSLKNIFDKIFKRRLKINDKSKEIKIGELYYEQYVSKYWSLIKYIEPHKLIHDRYLKWMNYRIENVKLWDDDEEMLVDAGYIINDNNNEWERYTSSYGSYYQPYSSNVLLQRADRSLTATQEIHFIPEQDDDDIMMLQ